MATERLLAGKSIPQKAMESWKAQFNNDPNVRFAILAESSALGKNLQGGDYVIHIDTPPDAASRKQRRGRAYRQGRTGDVQEVFAWTPDHAFDVERRLKVKRTAGMLEAVSGQ